MGALDSRPSVPAVAPGVARVRERIAAAARRSGRRPDEVTLIAVTKGVDAARIQAAVAAGVTDLGESRVQEARPKIQALGRLARWHLVGHLQRNKVRQAVVLFEVIHSLDSARLGGDLSARLRQPLDVLVQVNVAGERQKHGVAPEALAELASALAHLSALRVIGLMTMAPLAADPETVRPVFRRLRMLRDDLNQRGALPQPLRHLSMGMTDDFEVAVEEGATMVRIGRAIFGERG